MRFFLGTHEAHWLGKLSVPLFVSRQRLVNRKKLPRTKVPWALDSGAFTELQKYGRWTVTAQDYVDQVRRFQEIGQMQWASIQDWMCEPIVIAGGTIGSITFTGTHLSVAEHQRRTTENYLQLQGLAPEIPWVPVLQGWEMDDYFSHLEQYRSAGVHLNELPLVGVGTVCRRQDTAMAEQLLRDLHAEGLRLHGFGFKFGGLVRCSYYLASADSLAWSYNARRNPPLPGCPHRRCASCIKWALAWRERLLGAIDRQSAFQLTMF
jgi:hypothetical protein